MPEKLFYKIGEVSGIAGVEPYILRYWESEFPFLKPGKNKAGQRVYTKKNLDLVLQVKHLLYQEKYTIAGVRKKFKDSTMKADPAVTETIDRVKNGLRAILKTLR